MSYRQYCEGGSAADLVRRLCKMERKLSENVIGYILRELLNAVNYLHMNHVMHRDIRADNTVFTLNGRVKLTDFGFARQVLNSNFTSYKDSLG